MKNGQNDSNLEESFSSILKEEISNLKQIYTITLQIEKVLQKSEIDKLEDLIQKRGVYIQNFVELRYQELNLQKQNENDSKLNISKANFSYLTQKRKDILHQIENAETNTKNMLKQQMKEIKRNLNKTYNYQELRKTYIKEGGKFFDEAFFIDKKS